MKYIEYKFNLSPLEPWKDILIAYLAELPFESFIDTDMGFLAYIKVKEEDENKVKALPIINSEEVEISYERNFSPDINWNEEWEKNFPPIVVNDQIYIHTDFHEKREDLPYQIIIQPKMSFGTGHHETTFNMLDAMLTMNFSNKDVLDMGSGTGVLGIFAKMKGANYVEAIDIDEWSYDNALENARRNKVSMQVKLGDASLLGHHLFDIILANINKNILLQDMKIYVSNLKANGQLLLSGIYEHDFDVIMSEAEKNGLKFAKKWTKNSWISILLKL